MSFLPSRKARPSPLEQGDGMKHRKSSQRQRAKRRERVTPPPTTTNPLPPCPSVPQELLIENVSELSLNFLQACLLLDKRTTCMMERERWA